MVACPVPRAYNYAMNRRDFGLVLLLVGFAALCRVIPHGDWPNVAPVAAVALFAGWLIRNRWLAMAAPLGAMLISDAVIGGYHVAVMAIVYASLAAPVLWGRWMGDGRRTPVLLGRAAAGVLAGSVLFFLTTNLAHWAFMGVYERSLAGLIECYIAALPFFKYTVGGDLAFTMVLFGGWALVSRVWSVPFVRPAVAAA